MDMDRLARAYKSAAEAEHAKLGRSEGPFSMRDLEGDVNEALAGHCQAAFAAGMSNVEAIRIEHDPNHYAGNFKITVLCGGVRRDAGAVSALATKATAPRLNHRRGFANLVDRAVLEFGGRVALAERVGRNVLAKVADAERALVKSGELAVPRGWLARAEREALGRAAGAGVETKGPGARSRSL